MACWQVAEVRCFGLRVRATVAVSGEMLASWRVARPIAGPHPAVVVDTHAVRRAVGPVAARQPDPCRTVLLNHDTLR